MKIAFDFDGVFTEQDPKLTAMVDSVSERENRNFIECVLTSETWQEYARNAPPKSDIHLAQKIIEKHNVHIISRRLEGDREIMTQWLRKYCLKIPPERIHLRKNLDMDKVEHKASWAKEFDIFYDDSLSIVEQIPNARLFTSWVEVEDGA